MGDVESDSVTSQMWYFALPAMSEKPTVFISYARSDGLEYARRLRDWLKKKGIPAFRTLLASRRRRLPPSNLQGH